MTRETHPALGSVAQLLFLVRAAVRLHVRQRTRTASVDFRYCLLIKNTLETRAAPLRCWLTVSAGCRGGRVSGERSRGTRLLLNNRQELLASGHVTGDGVTHFRSRWSADRSGTGDVSSQCFHTVIGQSLQFSQSNLAVNAGNCKYLRCTYFERFICPGKTTGVFINKVKTRGYLIVIQMGSKIFIFLISFFIFILFFYIKKCTPVQYFC